MRRLPLIVAVLAIAACTRPYGAVPSQEQLDWQSMEMNMFCHFGPNTFTGREWGEGTEAEDIFNPTALDCRQWARTAKAAGFGGIIITAKHHDGFCLWPNPVSTHTVRESSWRGGKGDVLRELSEACAAEGLKFGIYISPWDRNDPHYGTPEYNEVFRQTLHSALTDYGPVFEQWFDGACGEGPNGKRQEYDWPLFLGEVFADQPHAIVFSNVGPGCRWVGNEEGSAGRTSWATFSPEKYGATREQLPGEYWKYLNEGDAGGTQWIPSETDVSIRPGWFWKESESGRLKSVSELLKIYYESVGRNSLLLLNVPPDTRGLIPAGDSIRLMEFRAALDKIFAEDLAAGAKVRRSGSGMTLELPGPRTFNRIVLCEDVRKGQRIAEFTVEARTPDGWKEIARETTVGLKRIVLVGETTADALRFTVLSSLGRPHLGRPELYLDTVYEDPATVRAKGTVHPAAEPIVLDLGGETSCKGIYYTPIYKGEGGVILTWRLETSADGAAWTVLRENGMFDNIRNNPVRTEVELPLKARWIRLTPLTTSTDTTYGLSDFGLLQ